MAIRDEVFEYIADILGGGDVRVEDVTLDTSFADDLGLDDRAMVLPVNMVHERFGVKMDDDIVDGFKTVGDMVDYVVTHYE
ncbi:acyl carrier protein [Streptomyces sp. NPDC032940]|uniref:acyl carrier protein n=1 Tax=Streptomyces sp. NPDC032940 TaxID=3155366 RepID=UPI0033D8DF37